jgi:hypothetical protein
MNQYRYKCPTEGCEIDTILVNVHEDVIDYFGFCCPFCRDHMVRDDSYQNDLNTVLGELIEWLNTMAEIATYDAKSRENWIEAVADSEGRRSAFLQVKDKTEKLRLRDR